MANIIIINTSIDYYAIALTIFIDDTVRSAVNRVTGTLLSIRGTSLNRDRRRSVREVSRQRETQHNRGEFIFRERTIYMYTVICGLDDHGRKVLLSR
jgi:hypothetical protein